MCFRFDLTARGRGKRHRVSSSTARSPKSANAGAECVSAIVAAPRGWASPAAKRAQPQRKRCGRSYYLAFACPSQLGLYPSSSGAKAARSGRALGGPIRNRRGNQHAFRVPARSSAICTAGSHSNHCTLWGADPFQGGPRTALPCAWRPDCLCERPGQRAGVTCLDLCHDCSSSWYGELAEVDDVRSLLAAPVTGLAKFNAEFQARPHQSSPSFVRMVNA